MSRLEDEPQQTAEGALQSALEHEAAGSVKYLAFIDYAELAVVSLCYKENHPVEYREHGNEHIPEDNNAGLNLLNALRRVIVEERIRKRFSGPDGSLYYETYTELAPDICELFVGTHVNLIPGEPSLLGAYQTMLETAESLLWEQQDREAGRPVPVDGLLERPLAADS